MDDDHSDQDCHEHTTDPETAYTASIPKDDVNRLLRSLICCTSNDDETVSDRVVRDWIVDYHTVGHEQFMLDFWRTAVVPRLSHGVIYLDITDPQPQPVFNIACQIVLMAHAMGCEMCVSIPSSQLGIPGTTLSLRGALRATLKAQKDMKYTSAHGIAALFHQMAHFLV